MTPLAVTLVTISAFIHALWNLLGKRQNPSTAFFFLASVFASLCLSPLLLVYHNAFAFIPGRVWLWVGLTSVFEAVYFIGLAGAYRHGDMSVAYPLAKAICVTARVVYQIFEHFSCDVESYGYASFCQIIFALTLFEQSASSGGTRISWATGALFEVSYEGLGKPA